MQNANPTVYYSAPEKSSASISAAFLDEKVVDPIDESEIFDRIRNINDPEHPLTLEQLNVVRLEHIKIIQPPATGIERGGPKNPILLIEYTPTISHCSMATLIGLSIKVCLLRCLPVGAFSRLIVRIREGTHQSEEAINKQLADKERVAAALENKNLLSVVHQCLKRTVAV